MLLVVHTLSNGSKHSAVAPRNHSNAQWKCSLCLCTDHVAHHFLITIYSAYRFYGSFYWNLIGNVKMPTINVDYLHSWTSNIFCIKYTSSLQRTIVLSIIHLYFIVPLLMYTVGCGCAYFPLHRRHASMTIKLLCWIYITVITHTHSLSPTSFCLNSIRRSTTHSLILLTNASKLWISAL